MILKFPSGEALSLTCMKRVCLWHNKMMIFTETCLIGKTIFTNACKGTKNIAVILQSYNQFSWKINGN